ncbi:MAG: polysaccharide biosynthesis protein, partial [Clostridia bacterium]|nr:polysaccharide biosynthesis protein [Clostridia bacterium]
LPVQMAFTGLRDGEKLTEELFCGSPAATADPLIFMDRQPDASREEIAARMAAFAAVRDDAAAVQALQDAVKEYNR